ncbi:fructosamine kinase family protein [Alkalinema sp. FACHB-956]|uniref:fructosamine kinase family protein n=1 Tax=Alkalinema sp. FACHB-956 TaxID=2692768 RepID=UPI0016854A08|nr:fructosamine kinase family protein [Alkalinema sp. FACHB-956]MBD2325856.1 fructosamine kinase family protein [Alkalinema sp. FACHB-956]
MWEPICQHIHQVTGQPFELVDLRSVGGGCINQGYRLVSRDRSYFVKLNRAEQIAMFEAEALGLQQMFETHTIRVPKPICSGVAESACYLVLEWLDLGRSSRSADREMGRQLARLHQFRQATAFGWERDNTIGSTPQKNPWTTDWITFWQQYRIGYQLELGRRRGGYFSQGDRLLDRIPAILADHHPHPSLVHGDLWGGNAAVTAEGEPVIFDPATYWGDREVDLAMTELFGGFSAEFYQGYHEVYPLDSGYESRKILYNLYHVLNHFNLFGGSYAGQADRMIAQLIR